MEVHYNSIGFVKGKGKCKILQSTPGPGIHYNSIGFVKGAGRPSQLSLTGGRSKGFASKDTEGCSFCMGTRIQGDGRRVSEAKTERGVDFAWVPARI